MPKDATDLALSSALSYGADIANTIAQFLTQSNDISISADTLAYINTLIQSVVVQSPAFITEAKLDRKTILTNAYSNFVANSEAFAQMTRNTVIQSATGAKINAAMMSQQSKYFALVNGIDLDASILFDIPAGIIKEQANQYYLSLIRPSLPTEALIIQQYIRGHCSATDAATYLGYKGVPDNLAQWLYDSYENYPSVRELTIASQYTNVTDSDIDFWFPYSNITLQKTKDFYHKYIQAIQLRTELNNYLVQLRNDYNAGLMSTAEFTAEIAAHKPNTNEQAQIIENANKQKARTLINMEEQSLVWLYRTGNFGKPATDGTAEQSLYDALATLGIDPLFANATVRFESCKLGYNWERV
jgi:hypothetical protein